LTIKIIKIAAKQNQLQKRLATIHKIFYQQEKNAVIFNSSNCLKK